MTEEGFELLGRVYTTNQWLIALGDNPWGLMDLTAAKDETRCAEDLLWVYDQLPESVRMVSPIAGREYYKVDLDDLLYG